MILFMRWVRNEPAVELPQIRSLTVIDQERPHAERGRQRIYGADCLLGHLDGKGREEGQELAQYDRRIGEDVIGRRIRGEIALDRTPQDFIQRK